VLTVAVSCGQKKEEAPLDPKVCQTQASRRISKSLEPIYLSPGGFRIKASWASNDF